MPIGWTMQMPAHVHGRCSHSQQPLRLPWLGGGKVWDLVYFFISAINLFIFLSSLWPRWRDIRALLKLTFLSFECLLLSFASSLLSSLEGLVLSLVHAQLDQLHGAFTLQVVAIQIQLPSKMRNVCGHELAIEVVTQSMKTSFQRWKMHKFINRYGSNHSSQVPAFNDGKYMFP